MLGVRHLRAQREPFGVEPTDPPVGRARENGATVGADDDLVDGTLPRRAARDRISVETAPHAQHPVAVPREEPAVGQEGDRRRTHTGGLPELAGHRIEDREPPLVDRDEATAVGAKRDGRKARASGPLKYVALLVAHEEVSVERGEPTFGDGHLRHAVEVIVERHARAVPARIALVCAPRAIRGLADETARQAEESDRVAPLAFYVEGLEAGRSRHDTQIALGVERFDVVDRVMCDAPPREEVQHRDAVARGLVVQHHEAGSHDQPAPESSFFDRPLLGAVAHPEDARALFALHQEDEGVVRRERGAREGRRGPAAPRF